MYMTRDAFVAPRVVQFVGKPAAIELMRVVAEFSHLTRMRRTQATQPSRCNNFLVA